MSTTIPNLREVVLGSCGLQNFDVVPSETGAWYLSVDDFDDTGVPQAQTRTALSEASRTNGSGTVKDVYLLLVPIASWSCVFDIEIVRPRVKTVRSAYCRLNVGDIHIVGPQDTSHC